MQFKKLVPLVPSILLGTIAHAHAATTILGFDNYVSSGEIILGANNYNEGGYLINSGIVSFVSATRSSLNLYAAPTSSDFLGYCSCGVPFTITRQDGKAFSLRSFDFSYAQGDNGVVSVIGTTADGKYVGFGAGNNQYSWKHATVGTNFTNLTSITFSGSNALSLALDNIEVAEVPIPAAAWLFGSALVGLAGLQRKKRA